MKEYKNLFFIIIFLGIIGLFLFFMPNIDSFFRNGKINSNNIEEKNIDKIPNKYNCSVVKYGDNSVYDSTTNNIIFNISNNGNINSYVLTRTSSFGKKVDYNRYKNDHKDKKANGLNIIVSSDDSNLVITEKIEINIGLLEDKSYNEYPTNYKNLKQFLNNNGYTCSK